MNYVFPLRIVQIFLAFLVLALCAAAIAKYDGSVPSLSFLLFTGIWGILAGLCLLLLAPRFSDNAATIWVILAVEFGTMVFFFAGFIAVAAIIGTASCDYTATSDYYDPYTGTFISDTFSYPSYTTACQCTKAAIAFGAFSWLAWVVSLVLVSRELYKARYSGTAAQVQPVQEGNDLPMSDKQVNDAPSTGLPY